jgi:arylsulfatase A-like enzyme
MNEQMNPPQGTASRRSQVVSRWLFSSAFLGLLIGLVEATLLWTTPRVIPLLVPDVGWVIWFLAPLVDMIFFGLAGLVLGWLASRIGGKEVFAALQVAIAVTFVVLMVGWFHREMCIRPFNVSEVVVIPLAIFVPAFLVSVVIFAAAWRWLEAFVGRVLGVLIKPLAWGLAAATVAAVAGIGIFMLWPPISGPAAPPTVPPPAGAPNIVFITLDTVRADHLSSYGYSRPTTPNIDRFARTGVLFENAIAPISWTLASHASMFTGLLPQQHGADFAVPLASSPWTLAEILRSRGYETAGFLGNIRYLEKGWGIAQGFETYKDGRSSVRDNLAHTFVGNAIVQPLYETFWRYNWFDRRSAQQVNTSIFRWYQGRPSRPLFLFINYLDAHNPYLASGTYNHRFGKVPKGVIRKLRFLPPNDVSSAYFSPQEQGLLVKSYDNCLAYLDDQVGKLLNFLRRSPDWQNTIVIITSDHGEEFGEHGNYTHGLDLYREELHVPLIIAGPGIPHGVRISHLVGTRQLFSTVLDVAGGGHTPFSRTSLAGFWDPGFKPAPYYDALVSELVPFHLSADRAMISLTTPEWQYIAHRDGRQELYNWKTDPEENYNLAASPGEQVTLTSLRSHLISLVSDATGPWLGRDYLNALDDVAGAARLSLLQPQPFVPGAADNPFRIGIAQAFFKPDNSTPTRPTQSERELMQSLPYQ